MSRDQRDATDQLDRKLRRACDIVQEQYDDRWPSRGTANNVPREWRPLDQVSREGRASDYRKWPSGEERERGPGRLEPSGAVIGRRPYRAR